MMRLAEALPLRARLAALLAEGLEEMPAPDLADLVEEELDRLAARAALAPRAAGADADADDLPELG